MSERWQDIFSGKATMYSYPRIFDNRAARIVWRSLFCRGGWHLWDEVLSGVNEAHYMTCDACGEHFIGHDFDD